MKNLRILILGGLLTGTLAIAGTPAMADPPGLHKGWENHPGLHKGWEKNHHPSSKGDNDDYDRYEEHYRHPAYYGRPYAYSDRYYARPYPYRHPYYGYRDPYYRHDMHSDRGIYRSTDIHNNVSNVPAAGQALTDSRQQVKTNVQQLNKDKAELRKDTRNRASRTEIAQDRAAIRQDKQNIYDSKKEVKQNRKDLKLAQ